MDSHYEQSINIVCEFQKIAYQQNDYNELKKCNL